MAPPHESCQMLRSSRTSVLMHKLNDGDLDGATVALEADVGKCEHAVVGRNPFVLTASPNILW